MGEVSRFIRHRALTAFRFSFLFSFSLSRSPPDSIVRTLDRIRCVLLIAEEDTRTVDRKVEIVDSLLLHYIWKLEIDRYEFLFDDNRNVLLPNFGIFLSIQSFLCARRMEFARNRDNDRIFVQ